ncbi:LRR and NB-ARC domain disease resistance protein [Trifolium medium]|uniref:LRR and NB-ARC domain disease resistance protein n=1 Tax=Trifolium medium TaxID=97028 RepID=A0A392PS53_9FABA|nr:LRR and NB-ARC domain disease resistance protein [Trifolium medium]
MSITAMHLSFSDGPCLPPNLQSIYIKSPRITMPPMTEWGLQRLNDLSRLTIGGDIVNTLLKEPLLSISLVDLSISNLSATKSIEGNGLRHLSSIETLSFYDCSGLESLSKDMFPSSLKSLYFSDCLVLASLSEDTLPSSLKLLSIWRCPLLEARYEYEEHWSNIAHIPVIDINGKLTM